MQYEKFFRFSPEVRLLLVNHSDEKVMMLYDNDHTWPMPLIGPRPPYYTNPRYEKNFPLI
ncbi:MULTISPECIES: hypothetical protein [unclassified Bacillus (in: firmicutes)]|uniref:hypothetical protein n=1 Tax=unclassified Bacillus (in: firmicutes) TaxID=185979 RepID=UPI000E3D9582|nr:MULTISPECIES: hypothetical protein [unclassified Bacillus (in: firmicutes)]RFU63591.1 hypothetical protein D0463_11595 [Bacillus sp. V59.32b]CAH0345367.1 hypothetical protein BCI9360_01653 [Bacillus sp. CECT 9360]